MNLNLESPRGSLAHPATRAGASGAEPRRARNGGYLRVRVGARHYGIDVLRVQEIRSYETPTRIANAPACITGVVNLRGVIVPIVDLRLKLGGPNENGRADDNTFAVVIVLNVCGRVIGVVVDSVSDVTELGLEPLRPAPEAGSHIDPAFITGSAAVAQRETERPLVLIDIEALMRSEGIGLIDRTR
jgi:purine-binding chemotaxis protein CheW